ncbi:RNA polymerase sigma factor [Microbacterium azadirachtae]|uniref:RNA polymerase sigma factor n=1 Tax=Microbacterium azadirachtae TaxID=582680 RepID=A0A0F0LKD3_9MICO|nr:sigma-70 family RNA polymerase sigma factor [Microbacterium azadirachtae]KJL32730.1 RNA polymerase sigma factor [Microbacterium azadirachtae]
MHDNRSDAQLLRAVRDGDGGAWELLWHRHYDSALRYARRLYWSRAEDLVSESFLAIYQQLRTRDNGPDSSFRAYLKTVIRNTSARWHADAGRMLDTEDIDQVDPRDGLRHVERESGSEDVLAAFGALPDRWQRVLWLSEVDQAGRPAIARELGIRPNAVSALQRRARAGMKYQWLVRQVPTGLRGDAAHVARLLPQHVAHPRNAALAAEVAAHLVTCMLCTDLLRGMHASVARAQGGALSAVLLGTVGAGVPVTASLSAGTAAAATTTAGAGVLAWLFAGGVTAATVGGLVATTLLTVTPAVAPPAEALRAPTATAPPSPSPGPSAAAEAARIEVPEPVAPAPGPPGEAAPDPAPVAPDLSAVIPDPVAAVIPDPAVQLPPDVVAGAIPDPVVQVPPDGVAELWSMTLPDASLPVVDPPPTSMQRVATSQIGVLGLSLELRVVLP